MASPLISGNLSGASAYAAVQNGFGPTATDDAAAPVSGAGGSFGSMLQGAIAGVSDLGRTADAKSAQAMGGGGNLTDVVMAVSKAEMALQASVAVRDKVIGAYQEIMRMAV